MKLALMQKPVRQPRRENTIPGVHAWLILWKAARTVEAYANQSIKTLGMGSSDFGVLEVLLHKGPLPVNVIGKKVLLTSGSMTTAINRLERKGLVVKKDHPSDHRTWLVHLTVAGRRLIEKSFAEHATQMEHAFSILSTKERSELVETLKKLGRGVEQFPTQ